MFTLEFYLLKVNNWFWMVVVWLLVYLASWQRHQLISGSHLSRFDLKATEFCRSGPYCACHRPCGKLVSKSLLLPLSFALLFLYFNFGFLFTSLFQRWHISMDGPLWQWGCCTLTLGLCFSQPLSKAMVWADQRAQEEPVGISDGRRGTLVTFWVRYIMM